MEQRFLYETLDVVKEIGHLKELPEIIDTGLAPHILLREYQEEAFRYFITYFEDEKLRKNKQIHTLFHMATGSGKTVIMAGLILYLVLVYRYTQRTTRGTVTDLIGDDKTQKTSSNIVTLKFKEIDYNVLLGASEKFNELKFNVIQGKYPHVNSLKEFLTSEKYLGNSTIEITYYTNNISGRDLFKACVRAFERISSYIISLKPEYEGSTKFEPRAIKSVVKDKSIYLSKIDENGGRGASQVECPKAEYQLDLSKEDWYVFNDNYGTSEEKLFIKFFKTDIEPKLKAKGLEYYVIRNERVPDLAIYSFEHGERFEPDYLLFVTKKNIDNYSNHQVYIEPKGNHLLLEDEWKENFLNEIADKHHIDKSLIAGNDYKVIGLPFFNGQYRRDSFIDEVSEWIDKI